MSQPSSIRARAERYAALRAALRVLAPSTDRLAGSDLDDCFREIRGWIQQASSEAVVPSADLEKIDGALDALAREVLARAYGIPLSQFRAMLPAVRRHHPEEAAALLDLCLEDDASISEWTHLIDYLVTLLACEEPGGRRRVSRDPASLTPRLEALCGEASARAGPESSALAQVFEEAGAALARGEPVRPIVKSVQSAKRRSFRELLAPEVLRAAIDYNVAVWNRLEEEAETDRTLGQAELRQIAPAPRDQEIPAQEPAASSAFDSTGMRELEAAVGRRIQGRAALAGAADEIARALDVSRLTLFEESAFRDSDDRALRPAVRAAVTAGLVARKLSDVGARLAELGIPEDALRQEWFAAIDVRLCVAVQGCVAMDRYEEARRLAEVRSKFLRPLEQVSAWTLEREPAEARAAAARVPRASEATARSERAPAQRHRAGPTWRGLALSAGLVLWLGIAAALHHWAGGGSNVALYSREQLAATSPYLESAYRDGHGAGPLLIGTLGETWDRLPRAKRAALAEKIATRLRLDGVYEVMLFDRARRLEIHYAAGRLQHPFKEG